MPHLLVVLQTHSLGNRDVSIKRYCGCRKLEVSKRCVFSLVDSLNYLVSRDKNLSVELQIFDDHSHCEFLDFLDELFKIAKFKVNLTKLETKGIMPSILKCYEHGKAFGKDWVFFVQDDFLFQKNSLYLMMYGVNQFSVALGKPASIHAFNDPYEYTQPSNVALTSHIVASKDRHWRTNIHGVFTMLTHHSIIKENWDLFYAMGTSKIHRDMEQDTISKLFYERGYFQFTPLPSLVLHMQGEAEKDLFLDWRSWWNAYELEKLNKEFKKINKEPKIVKKTENSKKKTPKKEHDEKSFKAHSLNMFKKNRIFLKNKKTKK